MVRVHTCIHTDARALLTGAGVTTLRYEALTEEARAAALAALRSDSDCQICLLDMAEGEDTYALPCGHVFHLECLRQTVMRYVSWWRHDVNVYPK